MLFSDTYHSILAATEGTFRDRGSKFLAFAYPVKNQTEIKLILDALKQEHHAAAHYCYAWRLGPDKQAYRINDDGEPSGSAGKPIYAQIQNRDLTNILVVVVRYFGGTLLGVPGLIHAYKSATVEALSKAEITELYVMEEYSIEFGPEDTSGVMHLLKVYEANIVNQDYQERNKLVFRIRKSKVSGFEEKLKPFYKTNLTFLQTQ